MKMEDAAKLLLEYRQEGRKTWAIRFYQDGQVMEYSDSEMAFENGEIITRTRPLAWRKLVRLSSEELKKLHSAMERADLASLPAQIGEANRTSDGVCHIWIFKDGSQTKTIYAYDPEASSSESLYLMSETIQTLTADAFERVADEEDSSE